MSRRINTNPWFDLMGRNTPYYSWPNRTALFDYWPKSHQQRWDRLVRSPWPGISVPQIFTLFHEFIGCPEKALIVGKGPIFQDDDWKTLKLSARWEHQQRMTLKFIFSLSQKQIETLVILLTLEEIL